jgi:hypothetical protein
LSFQLDELFDAEKIIEEHLADVVIDINELSYSEIIDSVVANLDKLNVV